MTNKKLYVIIIYGDLFMQKLIQRIFSEGTNPNNER